MTTEPPITTARRAIAMIKMRRSRDDQGLFDLVQELDGADTSVILTTIYGLLDFANLALNEFTTEDPDKWLNGVMLGMALADADHQVANGSGGGSSEPG